MIFKDGGPAYPVADVHAAHVVAYKATENMPIGAARDAAYSAVQERSVAGPSFREVVAKDILAGMVSRAESHNVRAWDQHKAAEAAKKAVEYADALIVALAGLA